MRAALIGFPAQSSQASVRFHKPLMEHEKHRARRIHGIWNEQGSERLQSWSKNVSMGGKSLPMEEAMAKTLRENLTRQLHESVERLQQQAEKVEIWASAVSGLATPVPDYQPEDTEVSRYVKPGRLPRKRRRRRSRTRDRATDTKPASA
jgi:hypothetical protein